MNTSPNWSRKLARLLLIEVLSLREGLHGEPNLPVDPESVQVLQTQVQEERTLVVVTFQRGRGMAMPDECVAVYEMHRSALGWSLRGGGTGCGPIGGDGEPFDVSSGAQSSPESPILAPGKEQP